MPEVYVHSNKNIYDFCGIERVNEGWKFVEHKVVNSVYVEEPVQRTLRYYISKKGSKILKHSADKKLQVVAGKWMQTLFINYVDKPWDEYGINYDYYIKEIYKEINSLVIPENKQLKLL